MFENGRKTIGVFATQVHQEYQETLSRGICVRAKELGYNVAFFTNFLGHGEYPYETGEQRITDLPEYEALDGIILIPDTIASPDFEQHLCDIINNRCQCPVVSVRQKIDEYYNVLLNDEANLDEIVHHFIADHGYRKINFLTGPKDKSVSIKRLNAYKRILQEYGIPVEEERIYYGDFWKHLGYDAVEFWLSEPEKRPEAIICANDYMAITVCNALAARGISVPQDIAVSGFDNISITEDYQPAITTAGMPIFEMGAEAVDKIHKHNEGIDQEKNSYVKALTIIRESCGCKGWGSREVIASRRNRIINEMEAKEIAISHNAFMSVNLTSVKTLDDLVQKLPNYVYMNEGYHSFYLCLYKNWDQFLNEIIPKPSELRDRIMEIGLIEGKELERIEFSKPYILPPELIDNNPQMFIFNMLHYQEVCFGYTAINFYTDEVYNRSYQGWLINICNALENIRMNNHLNRLVYKLEDMYIKDELTDLYNRRALQVLGQKYLDQCIEKQEKIMVFTADMDKLKFINDNYGHANGDIAIKAVADALKYAAEDDEICIRVGGDEFVVIGMEYDQNKINRFVVRFEEKIDLFNKLEAYEYKVNVSYGWSIMKPSNTISIEDCLIVADSKMYQQKYEKEALRLKHMGEIK